MTLQGLNIDSSWTLFLDRDGVINRKRENDYVKNWGEFEFLPGVPEAIKKLSGKFNRVIIVTNQQGIGKGVFTAEALNETHGKMLSEITGAGGRIDKIYYCPSLASENHPDRKPGCGMGLKAKNDFPEIDFKRSIIVGDSITDMEFGRALGMVTVFISENKELINKNRELIDYSFGSLAEFAKAV